MNLAAWEREHEHPTLPGVASDVPSNSILEFFSLVEQHHLSIGKTFLDVGGGGGRNAFEAARRGLEVTLFDASPTALAVARERVRDKGLPIILEEESLHKPWGYADESYAVILDDTASMSIGIQEGIEVFRQELLRVPAPHGFYINKSLSRKDELLQRFLDPAYGDGFAPLEDGKIERLWSPEELRSFFAPLHVVWQNESSKRVQRSGREFERYSIVTIFQKQEE